MAIERTEATSVITDSDMTFTRQHKGGVFLVIKGPDRGEQIQLDDQPITIGKSSECNLVLSDDTVSRRHLTAEMVDDEVIVTDSGSSNGTFLAGARIEKIAVGFGAEIKLGKTVIKFLPVEEAVKPAPSAKQSFGSIVGGDTKMRQMFGLLEDIAPTTATVLIEGETGTGKELIAEEIHNHSPRKNGPFIVFDCGSVPHELIESMLFGHIKGSFTGATADRKGAFLEANGGTIFLDEIGELALDLQPALLRALDKRQVKKVGASTYEKIDVRVVAATNRDLRAEVMKKQFREDLYYRLAVVKVGVPPLRERGTDIELIINHFIQHIRPGLSVTPEDMARLKRHNWPGNVRELRNAIERACLLARGNTILVDDELFNQGVGGSGGANMAFRTDLPFKEAKGQLVEHFEREYIEDLFRRHAGNLSAAAREAQIDRKHLRELLRKYDLVPRGKDDELE